MGYSAYSYVVFGVKTSIESIKKTTKQRSCGHDVQSHMKFCPECGEPNTTEKTVYLLDYSMEKEGLSYFYSDPNNRQEIVIGFQLGFSDQDFSEVSSIKSYMDKEIIQFCKDNNLPFTEKHCKTYVMTYHSY